jgi:hypothetical protein
MRSPPAARASRSWSRQFRPGPQKLQRGEAALDEEQSDRQQKKDGASPLNLGGDPTDGSLIVYGL